MPACTMIHAAVLMASNIVTADQHAEAAGFEQSGWHAVLLL